jgi:hypothetical protein
MRIDLPKSRYADLGRQARFVDDARGRVVQVPGVLGVGFVNHLPVTGDTWGTRVTIDGAGPDPDREPRASFRVISPGYFGAAGIRLVGGRDFDDRDGEAASRVVIVNRTFVKRWLPPGEPGT